MATGIGVVFAAAFFLDGASVEVSPGSLRDGMMGGRGCKTALAWSRMSTAHYMNMAVMMKLNCVCQAAGWPEAPCLVRLAREDRWYCVR